MNELDKWETEPIQSRQYRAHQLRLQGLDWNTVAAAENYNSAAAALQDVRRWLEKARAEASIEDRTQALRNELDRLDALQAAYWRAAMEGDDRAAAVVLKCIAQRGKYMGLEDKVVAEVSKTILISDSTNMAAELKRVVELTDKQKELERGGQAD